MNDREIVAMFAQAGREDLGDWLVANKRPGVQLVAATKPGFSKLGGVPDVTSGFTWPIAGKSRSMWRFVRERPMAFLAQIDLAEVGDQDRSGLLPRSGRLWFFYDYRGSPWGFDPQHRLGWRVFFDAEGGPVTPARVPGPTVGRKATGDVFPERLVAFKQVVTYPDLELWEAGTQLDGVAQERLDEVCERFSEAIGKEEEGDGHQMLGHAAPIQGPTMELECQLASSGIHTGGAKLKPEDERRVQALSAGAGDWVLLLQLNSIEALWMWGDLGRLYFWIRKQDLARKDFSNVWVVLQCF